jgi:hypothetical protein
MTMNVAEAIDSTFESEINTLTVPHPDGGTIGFRRARCEEIARIHALTAAQIGSDVASLAVMQRVYQHDPESFWTILRAEPDGRGFRIVGLYLYLYLNAAGAELLAAGLLDTRDPSLSALARPNERPVQIYIWAMVARKLTTLVAPLVVKSFPTSRYGGVPLAARAGTIGGLKSVQASAIADAGIPSKAVGDVFQIDLSRTAVGACVRDLGETR